MVTIEAPNYLIEMCIHLKLWMAGPRHEFKRVQNYIFGGKIALKNIANKTHFLFNEPHLRML